MEGTVVFLVQVREPGSADLDKHFSFFSVSGNIKLVCFSMC